MSYCLSTALCLSQIGRLRSPWFQWPSPSIHILDDDSLLNIFSLYRPSLLDEDVIDDSLILQGGKWDRERWWYKLAHVCRRWRYLILGSPSNLGVGLLCTHGTPVADILARSPPLPLIIDHLHPGYDVSAEEVKGMMLALQHHHRVRRIRLMGVPWLPRLIMAMGKEFPILEFLYISPPAICNTSLTLPGTFQAPRLRHLILADFAFPIGSPLLTTTVGLVTLSLPQIHPPAYFYPYELLQRLTLMPQLETLEIGFHSHFPMHDIERQLLESFGIELDSPPPTPNPDVERQSLHTQVMTHVTLPNLRWFAFGGASAYLEAILPQMSTPLLKKLQIVCVEPLTFSAPLLQFMNASDNVKFGSARLTFHQEGVSVRVYPHEGARTYAFNLEIRDRYINRQISSMAQILNALRTVLSAVEYLTLDYDWGSIPRAWTTEADRSQWRELLRPFSNVKTLLVYDDLVGQLSGSLQSENAESPMEPLPDLKELVYFGSDNVGDAFIRFINARHNAGHPVILARQVLYIRR
ncbi:hypothetical protein BJV74DRAFT_799698 [Russula compacta]|nr:hypothetical protein BJV74DRAFT_799698 [Russula compacta]